MKDEFGDGLKEENSPGTPSNLDDKNLIPCFLNGSNFEAWKATFNQMNGSCKDVSNYLLHEIHSHQMKKLDQIDQDDSIQYKNWIENSLAGTIPPDQ